MLRTKRPAGTYWMWGAAILCVLGPWAPATFAQAPAAPAIGVGPAPTAPARRTIGLALRGGAALGLAHIGALQWLDEHRIPVDYIAGTSIGGLVGAMYAMDYSPEEMRRLVHSIPWEESFLSSPPYRSLGFRDKEQQRDFPGGTEFGLRQGLRFPIALSPIQPIGLVLSRVSFPYSNIRTFDQLPIPFRCVAVDILSGNLVTLGSGSLYRALRATVAIPAIFTPEEMDGRVLVDGGLLNNLPTDVVRDMGADTIIALDFVSPLPPRHEIRSTLDSLQQAVDVITGASVERNRRLANIIVAPDVSHYSAADYEKVDQLAALGYQAAARKAAELEALALSPEAWESYRAQRRARERRGVFVPTFLEIVGTTGRAAQSVRRALAPYVGRPLDTRRLEAELTTIAGWGRFSSMAYEQAPGPRGPGLRILVTEKGYGPPFIDALLQVNGADPDDIKLNIPSRLRLFDVGGYGTEWRTDLILGSRTRLASEYYRPLADPWFVAPRAFYDRHTRNLFEGRALVARYATRESGAVLDIGRSFGRTGELRLGYDLTDLDASVRVGNPDRLALRGPVRATSLRWRFDGQDSPVVPTRGLRLSADAQWFHRAPGSATGFPRVALDLSSFRPLGGRHSFFALAFAGTTFGHTAPTTQQFALGGPFRLGALREGELRGSNAAYLSLGYLHPAATLPTPFGTTMFAGTWLEAGSAFEQWDSIPIFVDVSAGFLADTILGPVLVSGSLGQSGRQNISFVIGRLF